MSEREIRDKYGGKLDKAINRAIRAEVAGGNEALDKLTQLAGAARQSKWTDHAGRETPEAVAYFKHKRDVVDRMAAEVRKRWGLPADTKKGAGKGNPKVKAVANGRPKSKQRPQPKPAPGTRPSGRPRGPKPPRSA